MKTQRFFSLYALSVLFFVLSVTNVVAQNEKTKIRGKVIDAETKEPLPFVNIAYQKTTVGCITDFDGEYYLETRNPSDTLIVSYLGYYPQKFKVKKEQFQTINVELQSTEIALDEVVVKAGENPAHRILRKVIKNKPVNNPVKLEYYEYEVYNKMEFDVNNVDDDFKKKKVFNQFQFIFDYVDTSVVTGKSYLPVFISETISDFYFQKNPRRQKEIIKASRISGVENESVAQYTGQMYIDVNIYDNFIPMFQKQFVSPVADFGLLTYKYYLVDSAVIDGHWCYQLTFKPRRRQELTFTGEMWIHDTTFAIKKAKARIAEDANINYVNDLIVDQEYTQVNDSVWFLKKDALFVDFNLTDKTTGLFGRKTTMYKNIVVNEPKPADFFADYAPQESITLDDALKKNNEFWHDSRHEKLSPKEESIYAMVDSIKEVPVFQTFVDIVNTFILGYYVRGKFEYGPYYRTYSFNPMEGNRFRIGGRTSNDFSTKVMYSGHVAYGTKDRKFKYGLGAMYMFSKEPRVSAGLYYKYDIEQLGQSVNAFTESNILASLLARNPRDKLLMVREMRGFYEREWFLGFSNALHFRHRIIYPSDNIFFEDKEHDISYDDITAFELRLNTRFAWNEKFVYGEFERISFGSEYPILSLDLTAGFKNVIKSDYNYYKAHLAIDHHFDINVLGFFKYKVEAGKIWGDLPYPLLRLHAGNETYAFDEFSYNMMNYYEFVSDTYASLYAEHHFQGLFLNKVPLFRRLKWREVVYTKALFGSLDESRTKAIMDFPPTLHSLSSKPYWEAGVGIENIFKIIRIDAVWRLTYLDHRDYMDIERFGIRAMLQVIF